MQLIYWGPHVSHPIPVLLYGCRYMPGLQTAFQHYSHSVAMAQGRRQTFDAIAKGSATMNQAAFMRCCKVR